jgi:hypothetical protein
MKKTIPPLLVLFAFLLAACGGAPPTPVGEAPAENAATEAEEAPSTSEDSSAEEPAQSVDSSDLDPACLGKDAAFAPFADELNIYCDDVYMYIEADNLADHEMMVGITAWNQQVPIPQDFHDDNAWRIPLHPVMADSSTPTTGQGPVAVAINGVMVYNPTQQDGVYDESRDPYLIGELDGCGGHSGRADDYHYHIAPVCLLDELADYAAGGEPVAYAIDGFPIYGFVEGMDLDECRGAFDENGEYAYYASPDYPYVNACFSGEVDLSLQPATHPIRPPGEPIQVLITALYEDADGWNHLEYDYQGGTHSVNYRMDADGCFEFAFVDGDTVGETATYCASDDPPPPPQD